MSDDGSAQQLHDAATRGEPLSADERAALEQWYARQDEREEALLAGAAAAPDDAAALRAGVDAALAQLLAARVVAEATGAAPKTPDPDAGKNPAAVQLGKLGAAKGGKARAAKLTAKKRREIAKKAAARWAKESL